jgi:2-keto-4-pentenoate hydratase/2-oxohepta-3-ene-1,7-dioic acid hydratase in catechol pathway
MSMHGYRLVTYKYVRGARAGLLRDDGVLDIADGTGRATDATMLGILEDWDAAQRRLATLFESDAPAVPLSNLTLLAPIPHPGAIYCAGSNYADHVAEMARANGHPAPPDPHTLGLKTWFFIKSSHAVVAPDSTVKLPAASKKVDWEAELAIVIGKRASHVHQEDALHYVAGYCCANDLSARDLGPRDGLPATSAFKYDWLAHKNFDGSCPLGPWITPAQFAGDAQALPISLDINGVTKQASNTSEMIFNIVEQISHMSERITLYPGDVILTGTPAGVGNGRGEFLQAGDVVKVKIAGLGELTTHIA